MFHAVLKDGEWSYGKVHKSQIKDAGDFLFGDKISVLEMPDDDTIAFACINETLLDAFASGMWWYKRITDKDFEFKKFVYESGK